MEVTPLIDIEIISASNSKINSVDFENLTFGNVFTDHMLICDFKEGTWQKPFIQPYAPFTIDPSAKVFHYGQAIFEGMKAYKNAECEILVFRPHDNWARLNKSAVRMCMPEIPEDIFMEGLSTLLKLDSAWIPAKPGCSMYIRPFMFSTDEYVGVTPSKTYKFMIFNCPVGAYYSKPLRVKVETQYIRSAHGGVGFSKNAGNYALSLYPTQLANNEGYDQIMWTDANEHKYIEEAGTANLIFRIGDSIITPHGDTILHGVTRRTIMELAEEWGYKAEQRKVSVQELIDGIKAGTVTEAFAAGTAATITHIDRIGFEGQDYTLPPVEGREFSLKVLSYLNDLRYGKSEDTHGWNLIVK